MSFKMYFNKLTTNFFLNKVTENRLFCTQMPPQISKIHLVIRVYMPRVLGPGQAV